MYMLSQGEHACKLLAAYFHFVDNYKHVLHCSNKQKKTDGGDAFPFINSSASGTFYN
jgi:hypothetical protein